MSLTFILHHSTPFSTSLTFPLYLTHFHSPPHPPSLSTSLTLILHLTHFHSPLHSLSPPHSFHFSPHFPSPPRSLTFSTSLTFPLHHSPSFCTSLVFILHLTHLFHLPHLLHLTHLPSSYHSPHSPSFFTPTHTRGFMSISPDLMWNASSTFFNSSPELVITSFTCERLNPIPPHGLFVSSKFNSQSK
eukprot:GHVN01072372.1.p2 GENE.GHVN01072372.1~~GHVN01072372.1.p2  ORF type:complete len:188 (-),score=89.62 GHVN01072372.1:601-1164(-)